jgi:hypothetical protein
MADLTGMMQAAAGAGAAGEPILPQEVFSTTLYTGNGSTQTITNGIDLDGEGGLVWTKDRTNGLSHALYDTAKVVVLNCRLIQPALRLLKAVLHFFLRVTVLGLDLSLTLTAAPTSHGHSAKHLSSLIL